MKMKALLILFTLGLFSGSCAVKKDNKRTGLRTPRPAVRTAPNANYRPPAPRPAPAAAPQGGTGSLPYNFNPAVGTTHSSGRADQPYIALTFDDGPHPKNTPRLLDMLRQRNIKATFYVIGKNVKAYPALTRRIVAEGHELGNHTWTHGKLSAMGNDQLYRELEQTRQVIISSAGVQPRTMRPPYGALLQNQRQWIMQKFGYPTILWAVDPLDWQRPGPAVVTQRILSATKPGAIVLAHDLHAQTIDAMPATLDGLLGKGLKFVTVSQLLAQKGKQ